MTDEIVVNKKKPPTFREALPGLILLGIIIWGFISVFGNKTPEKIFPQNPQEYMQENDINMKVECELSVKTNLKSPKSADFEGTMNGGLTSSGIAYTRGSVDAQNTYGALIRENFICKWKWNDDLKKFDIIDVVVGAK